MTWKPWTYIGFYYDPDINAYICEKDGYAATCKYMAKNKNHLRRL